MERHFLLYKHDAAACKQFRNSSYSAYWLVCVVLLLISAILHKQFPALFILPLVLILTFFNHKSSLDYEFKKHNAEVLRFEPGQIIFEQPATGYRFKRTHDEIAYVKFKRFLGTPILAVGFRDYEEYPFKYFEKPEEIHQQFLSILMKQPKRFP